jgi:hypothetical protein
MSRARNNSQGKFDEVQYMNGGPLAGFRNFLINGDMRVAQRGTTGALTNSVTYQSIDRWVGVQYPTAAGALSQVAGSNGFQYFAKLGRTNGSTITSYMYMSQVVETLNSVPLAGQTITFSFYAKAGANFSATSNLLLVELFTGAGTDQSAASMGSWTSNAIPIIAAPAITTTLTRYQFTTTLASNVTQVGTYIGYTPTGTAGADDNLYITGVQLEIGSFATPFENRHYGLELSLCQRYYERIVSPIFSAQACNSATNFFGGKLDFHTQKRVSPTIGYAFSGINLQPGGSVPSAILWVANVDGVGMGNCTASSLTVGFAYIIGGITYVDANAEI